MKLHRNGSPRWGAVGWALWVGLALVRGLLYAVLIPPWQAPDETGHFEYAWYIAQLGRVPAATDARPEFEREQIASLYAWRYGDFIGRPLPERMPDRMAKLPSRIFARRSRTFPHRFSPAYLWQALFIWPFRHQDLVFQLYAARFSSVVLNLLIVWMAWRIFRELAPRRWAEAMTAFVVFLPQHTFINAAVGEGPLAELAACVVLYAWLCMLKRGFSWASALAVIGGTAVGLWTKKTALFLIPLDFVILLLAVGRHRGKRGLRWLGFFIALVVGVGILLSHTYAGRYAVGLLSRWWSSPQLYLENGRITLENALRYTFDSFWAQFGWMSVRAGYGWYATVYLLTALALEGWVLPRSGGWPMRPGTKVIMGGALLLALGAWLAFAVTTPSGLAFYQGRYLFPVTVPVAFYWVGGWARWTPPRFRQYAPLGVVGVLIILDATVWFLTLWPDFYAP